MTRAVVTARDWLSQTDFWLGLAMVGAYAVLRTLNLPEMGLTAWLVVAAGLTLLSPLAGLTILAALGPFTEALTQDGRITFVPYLLAMLGIGVLARALVTRPLPRPNWPIILAGLLMVGTALGVANSFLAYGADNGRLAAQMWVPGIGGAMTVLIAAAWVAWRGRIAPFFVAIASAAVAATLALVNFVSDGYVRHSAIGWLLRQDDAGGRLTGVIPAANPAAVIFMIGFLGCFGLALLGRRRWQWRWLTIAVAALCLIAIWLTGSRSTLLGVAVAASVLVFVWNRRAGIAAGLLLVGAMLVLIAFGAVREVPFVADQARIDSWLATVRLWLQHPLLGAGFRSFEWLHPNVGIPVLNAPHNEWLRLLGEEGTLVGLIGLAFALLTPIVAWRAGSWIGATAAAAAAGVFVAACFNNPFIYTQVNVPAFTIIGVGLGLAVKRQSEVPPGAGSDRGAETVSPRG